VTAIDHQHLRVLIADEKKERLAPIAAIVVALGHTVIALPISFVVMVAVLKGHDWRLDQAAATLGANRWRVLRHVTIPLVKGGCLAALLFALLAVWCALAGASLVAIARVFSVWNTATDPSIGALEGPLGYILGFGVIGAALIAIATLVVHSIFLCLTSINSPALGSGSPRFDPARAAVWWIESYLWAI